MNLLFCKDYPHFRLQGKSIHVTVLSLLAKHAVSKTVVPSPRACDQPALFFVALFFKALETKGRTGVPFLHFLSSSILTV